MVQKPKVTIVRRIVSPALRGLPIAPLVGGTGAGGGGVLSVMPETLDPVSQGMLTLDVLT